MSDIALVSDGPLGVITLHFNVKEHYLPLREFIETARNTADVINAFNNEVFGGALRYEVIVLPSESGTFKSRLGIFIVAASTAVWGALESDIGKSFVKGLTGNEPAFYAEQAGVKIREMIEGTGDHKTDGQEKDKKSAQAISSVITDSTKSFLETDYNKLRAAGISRDVYRDAYRARNEFYKSCYRNPEIRSIGFDNSENFPINRADFPGYIIEIPPVAEDDVEHPWEIEIQYIQVTSPNWDRGDSQRHWKAKLSNDKTVTFIVDDDYFWELVNDKQVPTQVRDNLKVQWAYIPEGGRRKGTRVLRVLEINGRKLADPLNDAELTTVLGRYASVFGGQPDLFG